MSPIDWLIVGGGIHGVHIAVRLLDEAGVASDQLRIVDPAERLLSRWRSCTETTGMRHLRSPAVHNLDTSPWSLKDYAKARKTAVPGLFARPYDRPDLALFNEHCDALIDACDLASLHVRARAVACTVENDGVVVALSDGTRLTSRNVVLALGAGEQPTWPDWAPNHHPNVWHVFDKTPGEWPSDGESVVVVGGGITAGQVALRLSKEGREVHLVTRHALREHQFDSDPGWLGPKFMTRFHRESDVEKRRAMIQQARHRGSVPPDVRRGLRAAVARGALSLSEAEVTHFEDVDGVCTLQLNTGDVIKGHKVLLATGFDGQRPGGALVEQLITSASLPCARCGYPIVDRSLRWHPGVYVSGPLAELELGPTARNIAGARRAAERFVVVERNAQRRDGVACQNERAAHSR